MCPFIDQRNNVIFLLKGMSSQRMSNKLFILSSKMLLLGLGDFGKYSIIDYAQLRRVELSA
jgi:hypothetical protein